MISMRRMLRVAAVAATCVYGAKRVWMESEQPAELIPESEEDKPDLAPSIPLQAVPGQQAKDEAKKQEKAKAEAVSADPIATLPSSPILEVIPAPPFVLQKNEALLPSQCPKDILAFLTHCGYKIHLSADPSSPLQLKNSRGDVFTFDPALASQDAFQLLSNFVQPPLEITSVEQAKEMLALQQKGGFYVYAYLPHQQQYDRLTQARTTSPFDTFHPQRKANLGELQSSFSSLAYQSASNANTFLIIRSREAAEYLRISPFSIGVPHLLTRTCKENGNESNLKREGLRLHSLSLAKEWSSRDPRVVDRLTHLYINRLETEAEAANKIRQLRLAQDKRKVLFVYTNEGRPQFHEQLDAVLDHVARAERQNVVVLKTQNELIARKFFHIEPDAFTTVRLLDLHSPQPPLFQSGKAELPFRRAKFRGAFKPENLCRFIEEGQWQQHYESKQGLPAIKPVGANELAGLENALVLLEKKGCQGCEYMQESLEELKRVLQAVNSPSKSRKSATWKYRIEQPSSLLGLKVRRLSIFSQSARFSPPATTPKLFLFRKGHYLDLRLGDILGRLREVKSESEAQAFHESVLREVIERVRRSAEEQFSALDDL